MPRGWRYATYSNTSITCGHPVGNTKSFATIVTCHIRKRGRWHLNRTVNPGLVSMFPACPVDSYWYKTREGLSDSLYNPIKHEPGIPLRFPSLCFYPMPTLKLPLISGDPRVWSESTIWLSWACLRFCGQSWWHTQHLMRSVVRLKTGIMLGQYMRIHHISLGYVLITFNRISCIACVNYVIQYFQAAVRRFDTDKGELGEFDCSLT